MSGDEAIAGILKTKLYAPRLPDIIHREELLQELNATKATKLTTMIAGAGYGKSTLAAAFLATQKTPSVWYQLEETDQDLSVFITYLVAGIGMEYGGFGEMTMRCLQSAENVTRESHAILSTLVSEMEEQIKGEHFVVLDDFQHVNESPALTRALYFILEHLPPNIHFIVLSRSRLNLDLSELAARRELVEITENDLRFSRDEVGRLFSQVFSSPLGDSSLEVLSQVTEGWVSGLVLFHLAFKGTDEEEMEDAMRDFTGAPVRLYEYLSRVAYENLDDAVKDFMLKTSILARMNPAFCDELLGIDDSGSILAYLTRERLFTIPLDKKGEWFRYHHLLRTFLKEILSDSLSQHEIDGQNMNAAILWEKRGEAEHALYHYLEAGDQEKSAGILEAIDPGLFDEQRINVACRYIDLLPEETLNGHPMLAFYLARISDFMGEYEKAMEDYKKAASLFEAAGEVERQSLALFSIARIMTTFGRGTEEGLELIAQVREMVSAGSERWCEASAFVSMVAVLQGSLELGGQFWSEAISHVNEVADEAIKARILYFCAWVPYLRGEFTQVCEIMRKACHLEESTGQRFGLAYYYHLLSLALYRLGRFTEALEYADKGLEASTSWDTAAFLAFFEMLNHSAKANALVFMGDREAALREVEKACPSPGEYEAGSLAWLLKTAIIEAYLILGDRPNALEHVMEAGNMARETKYSLGEMWVRLYMAWLSREKLGLEVAREEAEGIAESLRSTGIKLLSIPAHLVLALLELVLGHKEKAEKALAEVAALEGCLFAWRGFLLGMVNGGEPVEQLLPMVSEMFSRGEHLDYWSCAFEVVGPGSFPYLQKLEKSGDAVVRDKARELVDAISKEAASPLRVRMLGSFKVTRGDERIEDKEWTSKKALSVLKYMAAHGEKRLVSREVLMELLWPDSDPERSAKNLNMALTSLRKILEPDVARGRSSYIVSSGESLSLELGDGGWIDAKLFDGKLSEAKEAKAAGDQDRCLEVLLEAEELYRGDFLEEDLYDDWCRGRRESLKEEYLELLREISKANLEKGEESEALRYAEKAIAADPSREGLYRDLMEIYGKIGDRAGIERAFKRCNEYLTENFDVQPSRETEELYHRMRQE